MSEDKPTVTLQTIDPKSGKPPKERIDSAFLVAQLCNRLREDDQLRAKTRSRIAEQQNGNPPYNAGTLRKNQQADKSNVPFREAEGHTKARKTTYYNLVFDVPCLVTASMTDPKLKDRDFAGVIAQKFHDMLMSWRGFLYNMMLHQDEMCVYGVGPVYFPDERDWKFKALKNGSFRVDSGADSTIDTLEFCTIDGQYHAHELFWKVFATQEELDRGITDQQKREFAKEAGWNFEMVKKLIVLANTGFGKRIDDQYQNSIWESIQQQMKNNDVLYATQVSELIYVQHCFMREFRGKVSWYIVPRDFVPENNEMLFKQPSKYKDFSQVICLFFADIGDGSYHSVKGLGYKIYAHCMENDKIKNAILDGLKMKQLLVVQGNVEDVRKVKVGRCMVLPTNVKIQSNVFDPDIKGSMEASQFFENSLARTASTNRPDMTDHSGKPLQTATAERLRLTQEGRLERTDIQLYYQQLDMLYAEIKRRALLEDLDKIDPSWESEQKFKDDCIAAGVPRELLKDDAFTLKATRALGYGSTAMAEEITNDMVSVAGHFPEVGTQNAVRDFIRVRAGQAFVERYCPEDNSAREPSSAASFAVLENSSMESGGNVLVTRDQLHVTHADVHFEPIDQIAQQFIATKSIGDNPFKAHDFYQLAMKHIAEHMDLMKNDPTRKRDYDRLMAKFDQHVKIFQAIDKMTTKMQEQLEADRQEKMKQAMQQQDPQIAEALAKIQANQQVAMKKEENRAANAEEKTQHGMQIKNALANQKMILEARKAAAE